MPQPTPNLPHTRNFSLGIFAVAKATILQNGINCYSSMVMHPQTIFAHTLYTSNDYQLNFQNTRNS